MRSVVYCLPGPSIQRRGYVHRWQLRNVVQRRLPPVRYERDVRGRYRSDSVRVELHVVRRSRELDADMLGRPMRVHLLDGVRDVPPWVP